MRVLSLTLVLILACLCACSGGSDSNATESTPAVEFTDLALGDSLVSGRVVNTDPRDVFVALYAKTDRFYVQPSAKEAKLPVAEDGTWQTTTKAWDRLVALLVDDSYEPQSTLETHPSLASGVLASTEFPPTRRVNFAGLQWLVKSGGPLGPGPNHFSDHKGSVWVAEDGLHLRIREESGIWHSAEIVLPTSLGYGEYLYTVRTPLNELDYRAVFSGFVYESLEREIDIEFSRGLADPNNAQFVVQPFHHPGNIYRFDMPPDTPTTHRFAWSPGRVEFSSWLGDGSEPAKDTTIASWVYSGPDVPPAGGEHMRFNLWLVGGNAPESWEGDEVVVSHFEHRPAGEVSCPGGVIGDPQSEPFLSIVDLSPGDTVVRGYAFNVDARFQRVVVYAKTNHWFVQPSTDHPFTDICSDGSWMAALHPWERVVVLLVDEAYVPEDMLVGHPSETQGVLTWDEFPVNCTDVGFVGDPALPSTIEILDLDPGGHIVHGMVDNVDADTSAVVLYAKSDRWYVQPFIEDPFTPICVDGGFENTTHEWHRMLALLVDDSYEPVAATLEHPATHPGVIEWDEYPNKCTGTGFIGDPMAPPHIEITVAENSNIEGTADNIDNGSVRVVLWALTNKWYVQPYTNSKFTEICLDGTWRNFTHPWNSMVAVLADPTYQPPNTQTGHPANAPGVIGYAQVWK